MSLASVLSAPLASRGELLGRLFAESSLKELAAVYPVLLEDVFGFGGRPGWNLQLITRKCHPVEFERVRTACLHGVRRDFYRNQIGHATSLL